MSAAADVRPFDLTGELPVGVTVLEASAGTGKTYTIAALAARYVAEGTPLEHLLLVTFTRMATGELRERVRERLVSAERGLTAALAGAAPGPGADEVLALLAAGPRETVRARRDRLAAALAGFDAATIATTHGFCQEVLAGLGVAGDVERDCAFVEDLGELVDEVVDDLYVGRALRGGEPRFDRTEALRIVREAIAQPGVPIEPRAAEGLPALRRQLAERAREEIERRKRRLAVMTYDDLLTRLDATLAGPGGAAAAEQLRRRYAVVLVDEFQDTDPVQWDIVRRAFGQGDGTLVLIGDPKQAIYAFRGADVYAYLRAAAEAGARATLEVNWRSDQGLIDAYDALLGGARLGHEGIVYRRVRAAAANQAPRLSGAPDGAPLRVRVVHREEPSIERTRTGFPSKDSAREHVATDLAADVVGLLSSRAEVERRGENGARLGAERVRPRHLAVLVRRHKDAALIRDALDLAGVPAVINGAGSVFATDPAREWLRLLEAVERPASPGPARSAALTPFLGWSAERVACAGDTEWEDVHARLHAWSRVLRTRGVAALSELITLAEGLPGRTLAAADGERRLTDLRHVAQLLHAAATADGLGPAALTAWLRRRIAEAEQDFSDEERSRRLESDAEAVQVLTIHRSKGLEFPIVYLPYLWSATWNDPSPRPVAYHDPGARFERRVDVALEGQEYAAHRELALLEERGEDLRLAYVALTRARHQAVVWWAGTYDSRDSALGRLLFSRAEDGTVAGQGSRSISDAEAVARFGELAGQAQGCVSVAPSRPGAHAVWRDEAAAPGALSAARFDRALDHRWRRTSYSDITAGAYEARVASEPEEPVVADEARDEGPAPAGEGGGAEAAALEAVPSLLGDLPAGVHVGTLVHRVLEGADFAAGDLTAELEAHVRAARARRHVELGDPATAVAGLRAALETPLGPEMGDVRLCDVERRDRLDELAFELPLAGGDDAAGELTLGAIAAVLREHAGPGDALAGYGERLEGDPALRRTVRGYLTGSIDLVIRLRGDGGGGGDPPRFAIADYKTNRLGPHDEPLTAWQYRPAALRAEMEHAHYGLQALLYAVALHRYLRWRLPGYDPDVSLAGVLYLFLRGMTAPGTPAPGGRPCGVFAWRPSGALVAALSDALDRGGPA